MECQVCETTLKVEHGDVPDLKLCFSCFMEQETARSFPNKEQRP